MCQSSAKNREFFGYSVFPQGKLTQQGGKCSCAYAVVVTLPLWRSLVVNKIELKNLTLLLRMKTSLLRATTLGIQISIAKKARQHA